MKAAVVSKLRPSPRDSGCPGSSARRRAGPGPDRGLRPLPYRHSRRARGEWPVKPAPPFIPGHEGVGVIERLGEGNAHGLEEGMRVALPWLGYACGDCRYCNDGWETLCPNQLNMGYSINGSFAEYAIGYARHVVRVPDDVDSLDAAPLTCAGVTTYKAVKISGADSSSLVAVFGVGGLGHLAVQYARAAGSSVVAVDVNEARLETARELGAEHTVNAAEQDPVPRSRSWAARTPRSPLPSPPPPLSKRSVLWHEAGLSSVWGCQRRTRSKSRSSRPCFRA